MPAIRSPSSGRDRPTLGSFDSELVTSASTAECGHLRDAVARPPELGALAGSLAGLRIVDCASMSRHDIDGRLRRARGDGRRPRTRGRRGARAVMVSLQRGVEQMGPVRTASALAAAQSARRLRLPRLRVAGGARRPQVRRVLRERRQGRRRGGHPPRRHAGVLRPPLGRRAGGQPGVLAVPAGPARPIRWCCGPETTTTARSAGTTRTGLIADHLQRAGQPGRGGVLHLRPHQQRGRVPLPTAGPQLRHQQPAGLLEHVPRVLGHRADRVDRHRQGLGDRRGRRARRPDRHRRAEPGHQPSADAVGAGEGKGQRREDHRGQPAARGRPDPVQGPAEGARGGRARRADRRRVRPDPPRRRHGAVRRRGAGCCWRPTTARRARVDRPRVRRRRTAPGSTTTTPQARAVDLDTVLEATGIDRAQLERVAAMLAGIAAHGRRAGRWA